MALGLGTGSSLHHVGLLMCRFASRCSGWVARSLPPAAAAAAGRLPLPYLALGRGPSTFPFLGFLNLLFSVSLAMEFIWCDLNDGKIIKLMFSCLHRFPDTVGRRRRRRSLFSLFAPSSNQLHCTDCTVGRGSVLGGCDN